MSEFAELRALHWNIQSWTDESGSNNLNRVGDLINRIDPHVISLVEVDEPQTSPSHLEQLATTTSCHSIFIPAFEYGGEHPNGQFGNAILSRIPILDLRHYQLLWPPVIYDGSEPSEQRTVTLVRVQAPEGEMWIGSAHLPRTDVDARKIALDRLLAIASDLPEPWLLMGDFNIETSAWLPNFSSLQALPTETATYPTHEPTECIDYCIAPQSQRISAEVLIVKGSDHLPVTASFMRQYPYPDDRHEKSSIS